MRVGGSSELRCSLSRVEISAALTESRPTDMSGTSAATDVPVSSQTVATSLVTRFSEHYARVAHSKCCLGRSLEPGDLLFRAPSVVRARRGLTTTVRAARSVARSTCVRSSASSAERLRSWPGCAAWPVLRLESMRPKSSGGLFCPLPTR